jgi:hypothetical protein
MQTNSRVVSESLESYAAGLLAESAFFSALSAGEADPGHARDVFGQYYLWRNRFHRWFGVCVAKSAPVDDARNVPRVLTELIACLRHEIRGDHHRLALSFLAALGIEDPVHRRLPGHRRGLRRRPPDRRGGVLTRGEGDLEPAALPRHAANARRPAVRVGDRAHQGETEPGPPGPVGVGAGAEPGG